MKGNYQSWKTSLLMPSNHKLWNKLQCPNCHLQNLKWLGKRSNGMDAIFENASM
jgi:cytochrome c